MNSDTIHVLVCTYQGESFIAKQLDSILGQSYVSVVIHIFDDCSTDDTLDIVQDYSKSHGNIYLHTNERNIGFLKNFENAINSVSGSYIALSDQDDIWHFDKLKLSMKAIKELEGKHPNKPALVHSDLSYINDKGEVICNSYFKRKKIYLPSGKLLSSVMGHCGVMGNTILMNRLLVDVALPFPSGLKYHDYWLALVNELLGARKTIPISLVQYRIHDKNVSNNRSTNPNEKKTNWLKRDYSLPFMEDNREYPIRYLLDTYTLSPEDRMLINKFHDFLAFKGGRLYRLYNYMFLLNNNFLKRGFRYRLSVFFRMMLTKRYGSKHEQA